MPLTVQKLQTNHGELSGVTATGETVENLNKGENKWLIDG